MPDILSSLRVDGFAAIPIAPSQYQAILQFVSDLHFVAREHGPDECAIAKSSLFGYVPAEDVLQLWIDERQIEPVEMFVGNKRRSYSSVDIPLFDVGRRFDLDWSVPSHLLNTVNRYRETVYQIYRLLFRISTSILKAYDSILISMREIEPPSCSIFRALEYQSVDVEAKSKAHSDYELMALIVQSDVGLEIRRPSGEWLPITAVQNAAIIVPGEMLQLASEGDISASEHRVCWTDMRHSAVMFQGLRFDTPIGHCKSGSVQFGSHLVSRFIASRLDLLQAHVRGDLARDLRLVNPNPFRRV